MHKHNGFVAKTYSWAVDSQLLSRAVRSPSLFPCPLQTDIADLFYVGMEKSK